MTQREK